MCPSNMQAVARVLVQLMKKYGNKTRTLCVFSSYAGLGAFQANKGMNFGPNAMILLES